MGTLAALGGLGLALRALRQCRSHASRLEGRLKPLYEASLHKFYVDEIYEWLIARPTRAIAIICDFVDAYFVDGLVRAIAKIPRGVGRKVLAQYQNGLIQFYAGASVLSRGGALAGASLVLVLKPRAASSSRILGMATLLVITVLLPFLGSLVLLGLPKLEFRTSQVDRACLRARDPGIQPDPVVGV